MCPRTSLNPPPFIEVSVPIQENERSCNCMLKILILPLSTILIFDFGIVWYFCCSLISKQQKALRSLNHTPKALKSLYHTSKALISLYYTPKALISLHRTTQAIKSLYHTSKAIKSLYHTPKLHISLLHTTQAIESLYRTTKAIKSLYHTSMAIKSLHHPPKAIKSLYHTAKAIKSLYHTPKIIKSLYHTPKAIKSLYIWSIYNTVSLGGGNRIKLWFTLWFKWTHRFRRFVLSNVYDQQTTTAHTHTWPLIFLDWHSHINKWWRV